MGKNPIAVAEDSGLNELQVRFFQILANTLWNSVTIIRMLNKVGREADYLYGHFTWIGEEIAQELSLAEVMSVALQPILLTGVTLMDE